MCGCWVCFAVVLVKFCCLLCLVDWLLYYCVFGVCWFWCVLVGFAC